MGIDEPVYLEINKHFNPNPYDVTVTHNSLYTPLGTLAYSKAGSFRCGRAKIELKGVNRGLVSGNFISGQWACSNFGAPILAWSSNEFSVTSNYIQNSASVFGLIGSALIYNTSSSAVANRVRLSNNYAFSLGFSNFFAGGGGSPVFLETEASVNNLSISNNTVGVIGDGGGSFDPIFLVLNGMGPSAGLSVQNNVFPFGIGGEGATFAGGINTQNIMGLVSHPATPQLLTSTLVGSVNFTGTLASGAGYTDGAAGLGITATSTTAGGSGYSNGSLSFTNCSTNPTATYSVTGGTVQYSTFTAFGACTAGAMTAAASGGTGALLRPFYGLTPKYTWGLNVAYCTDYNGFDMSQNMCSSLSSTMPNLMGIGTGPGIGNSGTGDRYTPGASTAAREASAGYAGVDSGFGTCTPTLSNGCSGGANMNTLESALGIVSNISVQVASSAAIINYRAPDYRGCSVDLSSDGSIWTRQADLGGERQRSVMFASLTPGQPYQYRILCYFDQSEGITAGWLAFPPDPSNLATDGTFTTFAVSLRNPAFAFSLATFAGSTAFKVTMTEPDGVTQYSNTCATSPCVVSDVPVGDYSTVRQWMAGSTVIASSDAQTVSVR